jgi:FKBP-type peptidyl-prolyl cis-trans isomerase
LITLIPAASRSLSGNDQLDFAAFLDVLQAFSPARDHPVETERERLAAGVEKEGTGDAPKDSDTVVVNYKGTLIDGKEFDNSLSRLYTAGQS